MEIILVDDGSPDCCPQICDDWAARDRRISVIHKANGGLSDARNAGIDAARGQYLTFVDSDDYIAEDTYAELMRIMAANPEYDILEYPAYQFYGSERQTVLRFEDRRYDDMAEYWMAAAAYMHTYAWNKIYRRKVFEGVRFPVGKVFEDVYTLPLLLDNAKTVGTTSRGMYYYCCNAEGITATAGGDECRLLLDAHLRVIDRFRRHPLFYQYYMHVLNIQLYEYELTGDKPRLGYVGVYKWKGLGYRLKLKVIAINILKVKGLCKLSKILNRIAKFH